MPPRASFFRQTKIHFEPLRPWIRAEVFEIGHRLVVGIQNADVQLPELLRPGRCIRGPDASGECEDGEQAVGGRPPTVGTEAEHSDHYAEQLERGHIVLAVPCEDHDAADEMTQKILEYGAHDITYYSTMGMLTMHT